MLWRYAAAPSSDAGIIIFVSRRIDCGAVATAVRANLSWMTREIPIYGVALAALGFGHDRSLS